VRKLHFRKESLWCGRLGVILLGICTVWSVRASAADRLPVTPRDCVTTRYLPSQNSETSIRIDPAGDRVAYLVREPRIETNHDEISLYLKDVGEQNQGMGKLMLRGPKISQIRWLKDGRHITMLSSDGNRVSLRKLDVTTGANETLVKADSDITDYSTDANGDIIVFALEIPGSKSGREHTAEEVAKGYRIPFNDSLISGMPRRRVYVTARRPDGGWTTPEVVKVQSSFTGEEISAMPMVEGGSLELTLSPDGRSLLLRYYAEYPTSWRGNPYVQILSKAGYNMTQILTLKDLQTGKSWMPARLPNAGFAPLWMDDSQSFLITGLAAIGSAAEKQQIQSHADGADTISLFWVEPRSGRVEEVASHATDEAPYALWASRDELLAHTANNTIARFRRQDDRWQLVSQVTIPLPGFYSRAQLTTNGKRIVGDHQNLTTPPELFTYTLGQKQATVIAKLNPAFDRIQLASGEEVHWTTSTGYDVNGILLKPPSYTKDAKYPLVIQVYPMYGGQFLCDSGPKHDPSFIPQPLADSGVMYLIRTMSGGKRRQEEQEHYPRGYPGGIGEAALRMDIADSAVGYLDKRGLIDPSRIGIIGFSRGGWYAQFTLAHSTIPYRAATLADNVQYSLGEYWLIPRSVAGYDSMYGGPPYGQTRKNWLDYSISFNLEKIHTPMLLEIMGYGKPYEDQSIIPLDLATWFETFTGLNRLSKPVELYYYPNEVHQPEHPLARLASLQRNLDWYRFWLQGYERPMPEDTEQYVRWRNLRELQGKSELDSQWSH
jgi:dipeptidyl aminopeptidase/acylaminoacyl peptidase